jgi:hypothetical protein
MRRTRAEELMAISGLSGVRELVAEAEQRAEDDAWRKTLVELIAVRLRAERDIGHTGEGTPRLGEQEATRVIECGSLSQRDAS